MQGSKMNSSLKLFTSKQILVSWIFGTITLSSLMILTNSIKLKKGVKSSIFFFIATAMMPIYNSIENENITNLIFFNQLSSLLTLFIFIPIRSSMKQELDFSNNAKYNNNFVLLINLIFFHLLYIVLYIIFYI